MDSLAARTICVRIAVRYFAIGALLVLVGLALDPSSTARFLYFVAAVAFGGALGVFYTRGSFR